MDNIEIIRARKLLEKTQTFSTITTKSTVYDVNLTVFPVLNSTYENIGSKTNTGITFNPNTVFLNEKNAPGEVTADGDYYINYATGRIKVKAGANAIGGVTLTYYVTEQYNYLDADIQIGAVELKDSDTDNRANIKAANTARTTGTIVLATQNVDNEGGVLKESTQTAIKTAVEIMDDWDDGADHCQVDISTQTLSAVRVSKNATSNSYTNPMSVAVGDGVNEVDVIATINSLKTDLSSVAGTATDVNSGNKSNGSQRIVIATDDINTAAMKSSLDIMDDWDESDRAKVNVNLNSGIPVDIGAGDNASGTARVTIATNDVNMSAIKTAIEIIDNFISDNRGLVTEDNSASIKTAVEVIDNFISGSRGLVTEDNSASIKAAVETMDNWDESDRAKVNPIVGQAGIAAGTGVDGATVPRVTLATNVPLPAGTNSLGKVTIGDGTTVPVVETSGTKKALNVNITDGTNDMPTMDANSRAGFQQITDGTNEADVIATINSLKTDTSSIAGTVTDVNSGNKSNGSQRVVIATDDVNMSAIKTATELIDDSIYTTGSGTPSKGTLILGNDGTNPRAVKTDTNGELQVDILSSALPSGAATETTLASVKSAVETMDDWDESDRAKVNPIVGQAGIAGGTGVDGATVPRVSLATNVPLPTGTNSLGKVTITPSAQATKYTSAGYAASGVIKNSAGSLYGVIAYNSKTSDQFLQFHDASSLPADTAVPAIAPILLPAQSHASIDLTGIGMPFTTGIVWCNSSTAPTKTIGSADVFLTALYL